VSLKPTDADQVAYAKVLEEIKGRVGAAYYFLSDAAEMHFDSILGPKYATECAALQLRKTLELLLLGTLLTNGSALAQSRKVLAKKKPEDARKLVERINPRYWPEPVEQRPGSDGMTYSFIPITADVLKREDYGRAFGLTSTWCHATNPLASPLDPIEGRLRLRELERRTRRLVKNFTVGLVDRDALLVCQMASFPPGIAPIGDGKVQVTRAEKI